VISGTKDTIDQLANFIRASSQQVAEQHGGILKHAGIRELMKNIGNAVDVVHLQSLVEQVCALHAVQHTAANGEAVEQLSQLIELLHKALSVSQ
jgi:Ni,Fe-hydrogenase III large subunit